MRLSVLDSRCFYVLKLHTYRFTEGTHICNAVPAEYHNGFCSCGRNHDGILTGVKNVNITVFASVRGGNDQNIGFDSIKIFGFDPDYQLIAVNGYFRSI